MVMRLTEPPRTLAQVRPGVAWPEEVQAVMTRALERRPAERYPSTRDFGRALHAAMERMPAPADPKGTVELDAVTVASAARTSAPRTARAVARPPGRRELMIAAGVVVVLGAVAAGVLAIRRSGDGVAASPAYAQGIAAYRDGRRDVARERFRAAAVEAPADPMPHVYLSRMAREGNDLPAANAEAVKAVQLGPVNGAALRELASISFVQQNYTGARTFYTRALKVDADDRLSQGYLGCTLIRLGRADEGMRWLQRAGNGSWSSCAPGAGTLTATP